jgi:phage shock protein C
MDRTENNSSSGNRRAQQGSKTDFQESVERLERAVQDLVGSATSEFSDRASTLVDDITSKLEREVRSSEASYGDEDDLYDPEYDPGTVDEDIRDPAGAAERMRQRRRQRRQRVERPRARTARLYRDPAHEKIGGVCAGIARYYGMETWVVRCIAVTGLLFLPSIVFPAYWVAYFVMDKPPKDVPGKRRRRKSGNSVGTPELGPAIAPRQSLRNVEADLTEVELRLRRMESHVTSGQYELQKELNRIDTDGPAGKPGSATGGV